MSDNYGLVEGPWGDNFTFHTVRPEDSDKVVDHVKKYFLRDEPTSELIGYSEEYGKEFGALSYKFLKDGLSFWAEDNKTGEVAAVRITFRNIKRETPPRKCEMKSKPMLALRRLVILCDKGCDAFEHYKLNECAEFFVASTATKYRNKGLAKELYKRSLVFLAAEGFKLAKSVFTSPYSRAAARKLGFEEIYRLHYKDILDKEGNPVFAGYQLTDEHYGAVFCKLL